jgi:type VI protein secretion system component VasF
MRRDRGWHDALRQAGLGPRRRMDRQGRRALWFAIAALVAAGVLLVWLGGGR